MALIIIMSVASILRILHPLLTISLETLVGLDVLLLIDIYGN